MTEGAAGTLGWEQLPRPLRHEIQQRLDAQVVESVTRVGGFTPGFAIRLRLVDGACVFCKGVPAGHELAAGYRAEARVGAALPADAPTPRLLFGGEHAGWIVVASASNTTPAPNRSPGCTPNSPATAASP